jgi:hypothetical protein
MGRQIHHHKMVNEKLAHEIAQLTDQASLSVMGASHAWLIAQRLLVHDGSAISKVEI